MVLKSCLRLLLISSFFVSYHGFSQSGTRKNLNAEASMQTVDNYLPITWAADKNVEAAPNSMIRQAGIGLAYLPAILVKLTRLQLESYLPFQFKYAILMDATVEKLTNLSLYKTIDEWFGTRYHYGGTSHRGIDCSAFMQVIGLYAFGWALPRTAREQFAMMEPIDKEEIHEGDFIFFNTHGGVSHVGMYLQNNKFVHSCTSNGVMISDLGDKYWAPRIVGFKRMEGHTGAETATMH